MKIKKYVARNMPEALQQVRDDLGENAVILSTRQLRRNSRFNLADEPRVEVTAAYDDGSAVVQGPGAPPASSAAPRLAPAVEPQGPAPPASLLAQRYGVAPRLQPPESGPGAASRPASSPPAERVAGRGPQLPEAGDQLAIRPLPAPAAEPAAAAEMLRQLRHLHEAVARLERRSRPAVVLPDALARLSERLEGVGLQRELLQAVVQEALQELGGKSLEDRGRVAERVAQLLARRMPPYRDIRLGRQRKVVGFFGASGSGKTTAAAKIAAGFALKRGDHIVLVSADDRRVGALDQTKAFARIIGVPLEVAYTEEEMAAVLARHDDAQLVLVDAAGCGPQDRAGREHQRCLFAAARAGEVQVVIDAKSSLDHMLDQIEASDGLPERRLLFTKMDEVGRAGAVLSAAALTGVPASYFTVGPAVPGEIEAGNLSRLVARVIGISAIPREKGQ